MLLVKCGEIALHGGKAMGDSKKVMVALSGGVDSAVAAYLLREAGWQVRCAYIRAWRYEGAGGMLEDCPWEMELESCERVAACLGVELEVVHLADIYWEEVAKPMLEAYNVGSTPNPDIFCNVRIKFGAFLAFAQRKGYGRVATGHYVQRVENGGEIAFYRGADETKDQSYFLALCPQAALEKSLFPVGHLRKKAVRALARAVGLPNAQRKDSQGICFLGKVDMRTFLRQHIEDRPGPIVSAQGKYLGQHLGVHLYTLGQRKALGVPSNTEGRHYVVVGKDLPNRTLTLDLETSQTKGLWHLGSTLENMNYLVEDPLPPLLAVPRYQQASRETVVENWGGEATTLHFTQPVRALTQGQICALYGGAGGQRLLAGGVVKNVWCQ